MELLDVRVKKSDQSNSREFSSESGRRVHLKSSTSDRPIKLNPRLRQLVEDYTKLLKENQDLEKENAKLQNDIAHYFKEHLEDPKKEKKDENKSTDKSQRQVEEVEQEHRRRYESGFRVVRELKRKVAATGEAAQTSGQNIQTTAAQMEIQVQNEWNAFRELQIQAANRALNRNGQPVDIGNFMEYLDRIAHALKEWRWVGMKGASIFIKKAHLEEALRKLDNFGGDLSLNQYEELKATSRLHQERNDASVKELEAGRIKEADGSQVVAHFSEKVFYLKLLKKELAAKLAWLENHTAQLRENVSQVKVARDVARKELAGIKEKTGIMYSPHLLHDLHCKIQIRNNLIRDLKKANLFFAEILAKTGVSVVDADRHYQKMARGDLLLLPEFFDDEESMDIICSYDGRTQPVPGTNAGID